ncbi:carboxymuconolactone decarboxylase family protein [Aminobacter sp. HY435]|uniref:carboxymuconolactone decarboxylase family protein n=1 Tax=Aminobacter sp. HY435 TaxID=2970917 RepID=UPI0022B941CC|nr:carboxymuconolactone decarboxylase family protein [Aminobacter sp. HY435]
MQSRMTNPAIVLPEAMQALFALNKATELESLPEVTRKLVHLRASQINGCSVCVHMHSLELRKLGQMDDRIFAVSAWRDTPWFSDAERSALALTEAVTRIADKSDPVPDDVWAEATLHYDEKTVSALILSIGLINVWNRLNAAVRQVAGASWN